jgi:signal transduction histidine kinase
MPCNPSSKRLFLINADGGLISSSVTLGWKKARKSPSLKNRPMIDNFNMAEKAEFIKKDLVNAVDFYRKALVHATSPHEQSLPLSRIGRCYYKMDKFEEGINEYKKILKLGNEEVTIGNVPASIVALSQIADGYKTMKASEEQYTVLLGLYQRLLDHPWDLIEGDYLYYLKSISKGIQSFDPQDSNIKAAENNILELINREDKLLEHIRFIDLISKNIVPEIESNLRSKSFSELRLQHISWKDGNATLQLGYFKLPPTFQQSQVLALGYQIENEYILSTVLPEILMSVDLGRDVFVGILDERDSLLYPQQDQLVKNYLVAENFSQLFVTWKVALFDQDGKSIEQLVGRERQLYLALFIGIIVVMLIGIVFTVRAVVHESEVSRIRSEFVSNVSHELKTPLALIRMFGETLDTGVVTDEKKRREFYSIIRKESERLTHLINNVLDFSKVDSGTKEYNFEKADLVEVVRNSLEAYKFHVRDLGFEIENKLPGKLVMPKIDKDAISQVLLNLLSNAVKYSEDRKYIGVEVGKNSTSALISVIDHGEGISKGELKKIFDKFYRVHTNNTKKTGGSGLGLTLAKHMIEAHGGTIAVES